MSIELVQITTNSVEMTTSTIHFLMMVSSIKPPSEAKQPSQMSMSRSVSPHRYLTMVVFINKRPAAVTTGKEGQVWVY